jgi:hypothetical protein
MKNRYQPAAPTAARGVRETGPLESHSIRWLVGSVWRRVGRRVRANIFAPLWLPARLRHPVFGSLVAVTLEVVSVALTLVLATGLLPGNGSVTPANPGLAARFCGKQDFWAGGRCLSGCWRLFRHAEEANTHGVPFVKEGP